MRTRICAAIGVQAEEAFQRIERECVCKAKEGNEQAMLDLFARFRPLCAKCLRHASQALPSEDRDVLLAEVHYEFLLLVRDFEPERGVPFEGYIRQMLPRRVFNQVQKEVCRLRREIAFAKSEDENPEAEPEETSCAPWTGCSASCGGCDEVELQMWLQQAFEGLTPRQKQVMELTLQGATEREIAGHLGVDCARVNRLKHGAQKKLGEKW